MGRFLPDIEAFQQPFELLQRDALRGAFGVARPREFLRFEPLEPQTEAVTVPVQHLDLVAVAVDEHVQRAAERIESQRLLDQHRQTANGLAEVDRVAA